MIYVFTGPTLPSLEARKTFDAVYLPPVSEGDVYRVTLKRPTAIGIIDGYFEAVPSVWHKEILYALSEGVPVYGSASMGALRAAELWPFGMVGVGSVFEAFRDGIFEDDDEVAIEHGPGELGYPQLSEALVNVRRTLADALVEAVIGQDVRDILERIAKALPYRERSYAAVLKRGRDAGLPPRELGDLKLWLPQGRVDQKREDALAMLIVMKRLAAYESWQFTPRFHFERTTLWQRAVELAAEPPAVA